MVCKKHGETVELENTCFVPLDKVLCGEWQLIKKGWLSSSTVCLITPPKTRKMLILLAENGRKLVAENESILEKN